jgi:hypothetical protein
MKTGILLDFIITIQAEKQADGAITQQHYHNPS